MMIEASMLTKRPPEMSQAAAHKGLDENVCCRLTGLAHLGLVTNSLTGLAFSLYPLGAPAAPVHQRQVEKRPRVNAICSGSLIKRPYCVTFVAVNPVFDDRDLC